MCDELIKYIDTEKTTIAILKAYYDMEWKLENGREQVEEIETRLVSSTSHLGSAPVSGGGGNKAERAMVFGLHQKEIAERGLEAAAGYMKRFIPAWERLTEQERYLLRVRYVDYGYENRKWTDRVHDRYGYEKSQAYDLCSAALERLSTLLWW